MINPARAIIFGEALFDTFPDGTAVLGGAPFNVAWHLQGFGLTPLFISRVGSDARAEQVLDAMTGWGMDLAGVQRDSTRPTGVVQIQLQGKGHSFDIVPDQAYDHIDADAALGHIGDDSALLYHGSLIARAPGSRQALERLRAAGLPTFVDINLRAPWWDEQSVKVILQGARWVKLNDEELVVLSGGTRTDQIGVAQSMRAHYGLAMLVVTRGAGGAFITTADDLMQGSPVTVDVLVDTVGAGDAFSSVVILGLIHDWPLGQTLQRALEFAAAICRIRGATTTDRNLYSSHLQRWQHE